MQGDGNPPDAYASLLGMRGFAKARVPSLLAEAKPMLFSKNTN
jgi:hypothetical protein